MSGWRSASNCPHIRNGKRWSELSLTGPIRGLNISSIPNHSRWERMVSCAMCLCCALPPGRRTLCSKVSAVPNGTIRPSRSVPLKIPSGSCAIPPGKRSLKPATTGSGTTFGSTTSASQKRLSTAITRESILRRLNIPTSQWLQK